MDALKLKGNRFDVFKRLQLLSNEGLIEFYIESNEGLSDVYIESNEGLNPKKVPLDPPETLAALRARTDRQTDKQTNNNSAPILSTHPTPKKEKIDFSIDHDDFYAAYPNKKAKPESLKAYNKARTVKKATHSEIMEGLSRYMAHKEDYRDWLQPATFLNKETWKDEYIEKQIKPSPYRHYRCNLVEKR
jgi:hypothetical protein